MKFRFTAKDFLLENISLNPGLSVAYVLAEKANALLEEAEKKCERVYKKTYRGFVDRGAKVWKNRKQPEDSHTAILWNVELMRDEK